MANRRTRRGSARGRAKSEAGRLPDWVWGAGFGAIIVAFLGLWVLLGSFSGDSAAACDQSLGALGTSEVSQQAFAQEVQALDRVIQSLETGDRTGAEAAFLGPVHGFTHNVQPAVKDRDEARGKSLCEAVLRVENDLATRVPDLEFAQSMRALRDEVRQSASALGYTVDGE